MKKSFLFILILSLFTPELSFANEKGMVLIKSGCFFMGTDRNAIYEDDDNNSREKPSHKVCLDPFYLEVYEVTQKKWNAVMSINRSVFHHPKQPKHEDLPSGRPLWTRELAKIVPPPNNYDIKRNIEIKPINPRAPCLFGSTF